LFALENTMKERHKSVLGVDNNSKHIMGNATNKNNKSPKLVRRLNSQEIDNRELDIRIIDGNTRKRSI